MINIDCFRAELEAKLVQCIVYFHGIFPFTEKYFLVLLEPAWKKRRKYVIFCKRYYSSYYSNFLRLFACTSRLSIDTAQILTSHDEQKPIQQCADRQGRTDDGKWTKALSKIASSNPITHHPSMMLNTEPPHNTHNSSPQGCNPNCTVIEFRQHTQIPFKPFIELFTKRIRVGSDICLQHETKSTTCTTAISIAAKVTTRARAV